MSSPDLPFYLRGNFAPVAEEVTATDLPVEGALPPSLRGLFLRNGPNPKPGADPGHWFLGDGMVHGVRFEDGEASWYRNRWVRTRPFEEGEDAIFLRDDFSIDLTVAVANTHVIGHAGRILALVESSFPTELTPELETVGICDFDGKLATAMTAHPKRCPRTGELHFFGYGFFPPYLTYHCLDPAGKLVRSEAIEVPAPTMMHDFALTEHHVIFMDLPIVYDLAPLAEGKRFDAGARWSDDHGARLGVMPRGGSAADVRWLEIQPCYVFHPMNAHERDGRIVMDVARYPELWRGSAARFDSAYLHRWTLDLQAGKVSEESLDDRSIEFPRIDDRRVGLEARYGYAVRTAVEDGIDTTRLVKYDLRSGTSEEHELGPGCAPSEGVFAPAGDGSGEEDGFVLSFVYDAARDASELVVLDAGRFGGPPVARVKLPQRVPFGFHGSWLPDTLV